MKVWLADLTYTQQSIASDVVPAAIGMIAEYLESQIKSYNDLFGNSIEGLSRTLSRVYIKKLFRSSKSEQFSDREFAAQEFEDNNSRRWGGGLESI
jgi:vacuolar-type H+-ATPase subunit C/Vma6